MNSIEIRERVAALRPGAEAFQALAEAVDQCVFTKDTTGRYVFINRTYCKWLSCTETEVVGRTVFDLWPPAVAAALAADDRRVLAGECVHKEEQRPNALELRTLKTVKVPVTDKQGRVVGILGCFTDVTDERRRDEEYRQALRFAVVGRLAAGLTHDLNHLLTLVQGNAALLAMGSPHNSSQQALAERVESAIARAAEMTSRLHVVTQTERSADESAQLNDAVVEVTNLFRAVLDPRVALEVDPRHELPRVRVPLSQLTQVVLNLCLNARDAMPEGGRLKLETSLIHQASRAPSEPDDDPAVGRHRGAFVRLRVADTGRGMTPEIKDHMFDPWYTTKTDGNGSGLGLAVVQDVALRSGGWVECASTFGQGTNFSVFFPADDAAPSAGTAPAPVETTVPPTLLLVDNDPSIVALCKTLLEAKGYRVHTVEDGREAAAVYRREQGRIGVVLLDQNMPGLSGLDVLSELAATDPRVRVLLMSGAPLEDVPPAFDRNVRGFLTKPFRSADLLKAIQEALAGD